MNGSQDPPHPASYVEVLQMLKQGITPPGIRDDIVDTPPDPMLPPSEVCVGRHCWQGAHMQHLGQYVMTRGT